MVFLEAPSAALRQVHVGLDPGDGIRGGEDEEDLVFEVVEHDWRQQCDGEICQAPDDHAGSRPLRLGSRRVSLRGDEPDDGKPVYPKRAGRDE